ncbi:hypothetical protein BSL78_17102 [Apostichopus japonicus]|uniref:Uncharacterized protein n=1 Tax=Stichopus japonicus TaxID=307972 RepID=A0A2G8KDF5_STIJA|nr:hypothetical protein BSL78_17102 [Apostichopus japonicus]
MKVLLICDSGSRCAYAVTMDTSKTEAELLYKLPKPDIDGDFGILEYMSDRAGFVYILWESMEKSIITQYSQDGQQLLTTKRTEDTARCMTTLMTEEGEKLLVATSVRKDALLWSEIEKAKMDTNNEGHLLNSSPLSVNYDNGEIRNVNNCLKALMWLHGVVTWPLSTGTASAMFDDHDKKRWKERLTFFSSLISLVVLTFTSMVALLLYLYCYFGRIDHFLRFVSYQCYWPSLMSAQIICLAALIKNQVGKRRNISWVKVFSVKCCARIMSSFTSKTGTIPLPKCSAFLILYLLVPTVHSALKLTFFITLETECQNFPEYLWLISEISVAYFFSMFCYFLYLNRINLERESEIASKFIQQHVGEFDECISTVTTFFREYYQLRKILVPWLNFVIFNSTFGLTVFFTWNFNEIVLPSSTTSVPITDSYVLLITVNVECAATRVIGNNFCMKITLSSSII